MNWIAQLWDALCPQGRQARCKESNDWVDVAIQRLDVAEVRCSDGTNEKTRVDCAAAGHAPDPVEGVK